MSDDGSEEPSFVHPTFGFGISENDKELVRMSSELQTRGGSQKTNKKSIRECLGKPWRRLRSILKSPSQRRADENMKILRTTIVRQVNVNTTMIPDAVVQIAARRTIIGQTLRPETAQAFAEAIKQWYNRHGFVCHSVIDATLVPETSTVEISVAEPKSADPPVHITFCAERVLDGEELLTPRQYRRKHTERRTVGFRPADKLNTTLVVTDKGKTRPRVLSQVLGLKSNSPFSWNAAAWRKIAGSGIFHKVYGANPTMLKDGTVQLQLMVQEAPPRHLEYGLARSLYTGQWEGEIDFENVNLLGGGETLGVSLRQGSRGPSGRARFRDTKYGMDGGYDVEVFSEYVGDNADTKAKRKPVDIDLSDESQTAAELQTQEDSEVPLSFAEKVRGSRDNRKGAMFRVYNPIDPKLVANSVASASLERVSSKCGKQGTIGTSSISLGPFTRELPLGARSNVDTKILVGSRVEQTADTSRKYFPFSSVVATTRQTFPLLATSASPRSIVLALKHSAVASSRQLPHHEAIAQGVAFNVRGGRSSALTTALSGTTELRIPIQLPVSQVRQDASVVLFGDWVLGKSDCTSPFARRACVGLGFRKSIQGIPLTLDVTYSKMEKKIKTNLSLGRDFEI